MLENVPNQYDENALITYVTVEYRVIIFFPLN